MFEYSLGCSPKRGDEPRDLLRGPTTISIAGNRTQFSRTEGKDFPSERVAVFSLSRPCCQRLCETNFSARFPFWTASSAARPWWGARPCGVRSGSRDLVSGVFAVKDFVKLSSATPVTNSPWCPALFRSARRRWGPKREAVYAPARPPSASTFVTICRFQKNAGVS